MASWRAGGWLFALMLAVFAGLSSATPAVADDDKDAAIIIDANSGKVLYSRSPDALRFPASLTKVMTLYLLFEQLEQGKLKLSSQLTASGWAEQQEPSRLGLSEGDTITVEEAIRALVVRSANDVAVVVAESVAGSEHAFARRMTEKARAIGMRKTTFRNASGLPDDKQVTTARDLAVLGQRIMFDFPVYYRYFRTSEFAWEGSVHPSHNRLLRMVDGADGIKTGYTRASGFNLLSSVRRRDGHLIGVVMGGRTARSRDQEMAGILEMAFDRIGGNPSLVARAPTPEVAATPAAAIAVAEVEEPASPPPAAPKPAPRETAVAALAPEPERPQVFAAEEAPRPAPKPGMVAAAAVPGLAPAPAPAAAPGTLGSISAADLARFDNSGAPKPEPVEVQSASLTALATPEALEEGDIGNQATDAVEPAREITYGIQIGAFDSQDAAAKQLSQLASRARHIVGDSEQAVVPITAEGRTLYRARFGAYGENKARDLCRKLSEVGVTCFTVKQTEWRPLMQAVGAR